MPTRNVVVTQAQEELIERLVARGRFQNASEVLRSGLRLVEEQEAALEKIRAGILEGLEDVAQGRVYDGEPAIHEAFAEAMKRGGR
jgi:antitoxin ParD1/3/4